MIFEKKPNVEFNAPEWLLKNEEYTPITDKDTFVNKSILSIFKLLSSIKIQDSVSNDILKINVSLKVFFTFLLVLLVSLTRSFSFIIIIIVYLLGILCFVKEDKIIKILKLSFLMTAFTAIIMFPAFLYGNTYSFIMITTKVFISVTGMGMLSNLTKWYAITEALKRFHIPDTFILILDLTIKYIYMLGEFSLNMLYALKLRSVGKNNKKYSSLSGIAGTLFLHSKDMSEDMYHAMECRGFSGEYHVNNRSKFTLIDYLYIGINIGILCLFIYFGRYYYD